jgi:hypothetical protein
MFSRSKVELGLATIYIHHTSAHMHILIWLYDLTIFALQVGSSFLPTYELHIRLSSRKRKTNNIFIALVRIHKYHIYWDT